MMSVSVFLALICVLLSLETLDAKSEMDQLNELLSATTGATLLDTSDPEVQGSAALKQASLSLLNDPLDGNVADEQTRINTLVRAFRRLPNAELSAYADLSTQLDAHGDAIISADSDLAKRLQNAWESRQVELKKAIDDMVRPGEHLRKLLYSSTQCFVNNYCNIGRFLGCRSCSCPAGNY